MNEPIKISQDGMDMWSEVEMFRIVHGRLPNQETDMVDKVTYRKFKKVWEKMPLDLMAKNLGLMQWANNKYDDS